MKAKRVDTWDYQYTFSMWNNDGLAILPNINMISNIGFGADATHTFGESEFANMPRYDIINISHPSEVVQNKEADDFTSKLMFNKKSIFERVVSKIKRLLK